MTRNFGKIFVLLIYLGYLIINCCAQLFAQGNNYIPNQTSFIKINITVSVRLSRSYENQRQVSIKKALVQLQKVKSNSLNTCFSNSLDFNKSFPKLGFLSLCYCNSYKPSIFIDVCNLRI